LLVAGAANLVYCSCCSFGTGDGSSLREGAKDRLCWKKRNDVAKMRQAGTAPATGTTIYCLTSLWCIVIYKRCSAMDTTNTLLRANVRLVLRSDLCRIYCAIYGCIFGVASCVTDEVRFVCIDLNGSIEFDVWINGGVPSLPCRKVWINAGLPSRCVRIRCVT